MVGERLDRESVTQVAQRGDADQLLAPVDLNAAGPAGPMHARMPHHQRRVAVLHDPQQGVEQRGVRFHRDVEVVEALLSSALLPVDTDAAGVAHGRTPFT
jgi:hypothetical protein